MGARPSKPRGRKIVFVRWEADVVGHGAFFRRTGPEISNGRMRLRLHFGRGFAETRGWAEEGAVLGRGVLDGEIARTRRACFGLPKNGEKNC